MRIRSTNRKILAITLIGISIPTVISLTLGAGGEFNVGKILEKLRELIPDHEIAITWEEIQIGKYSIMTEGGWKIVIGKLPETEVEIEKAIQRVKTFHQRYREFVDPNWLHEKYRVWSIGGSGTPLFCVSIEGPLSERLDAFVEVFYILQDASGAAGVGTLGKDIPVVLRECGPVVLHSRTARYDTLFGGIMVTNELGHESTLCAAAKRYDWIGFLVAGHATLDKPAWVGMDVYQPTIDPANHRGEVQQVGGYRSDAAFVFYASVTPKIYLNYLVAEYLNPAVGDPVRKSGIATDETYGQVDRYEDVYNPAHGRILTDQVIADYYSEPGDSGSPVFFPVYYQYVAFYGIHWGYWGWPIDEAVFSPTSAIYADVHAVPLTV